MIPVLVTPPTDPVLSLDALKAHLRLATSSQDDALVDLVAEVTAYLDGWRGVLGRAMMPQRWAQQFDDWGYLRLAMPDVTNIVVTGRDEDDASVTPTVAILGQDHSGVYVVTDGDPIVRVVIEYTCGLPEQQLPEARALVKMIAAHWYENREAVMVGGAPVVLPMAAEALISAMRWRTA